MKPELWTPFQYALQTGCSARAKHLQAMELYGEVQRETLREILQKNKWTEYGLLYNFASLDTERQFKEYVPLTTYRVYKPYVQRMLQCNDKNLLCAEPVSGWALTSATSGSVKYIPQNKTMESFFTEDLVLRGLSLAEQQYFERKRTHVEAGRLLILMGGGVSYTNNKDSEESMPVSSISAITLITADANLHPLVIPPLDMMTTKRHQAKDEGYLYLRFALTCRDLIYMISIYDDYILGILRYLNLNWKKLCDEIELGTYDKSLLNLDTQEEQKYREFLQPDADRAQELRSILCDGLQKDTIHKIWPDLQVVSAASKVGTFVSKNVLNQYLCGITRDYSPYGATESMMGVAPEPGDDRIYLLPHVCYYEFIPEKDIDKKNPAVYSMEELIDGERYELVITTQAGFYRYRLGDLLQVVGRKQGCPIFRFEGRKGIGLDLASEKAPENALRNAIIVAAVHRRIPLKGFCIYGEGERSRLDEESTLRYVVQFETDKEMSESAIEAFARETDHQISSIVKSYKGLREEGILLPLRVERMAEGAFADYEEKERAKSQIPSQYKRPFILKLE